MIIYSATNKINGKKYIGQTTKSLEYRMAGHLKCAQAGYDRKFYHAINKYGWENFEFKIECYCSSIEELNQKETEYITKFDTVKNGYNMGYGGDNNVMFSKEVKEKHARKMSCEEVRKKLSKSMKESIAKRGGYSLETRKKISEKLKGNQHGKDKVRPMEAILATAAKNFKPVYCLDESNTVVAQFKSVKDAADWWFKHDPCPLGYAKYYCDIIKESFKKDIFKRGLKWIYGVPCVETIETRKKEVE